MSCLIVILCAFLIIPNGSYSSNIDVKFNMDISNDEECKECSPKSDVSDNEDLCVLFKDPDATPFHEAIRNDLKSVTTVPSLEELFSIYNWMKESHELPPYIRDNQYLLMQNISSHRDMEISTTLNEFENSNFYDFAKQDLAILPAMETIRLHIGIVTTESNGGIVFFYRSTIDSTFWDGRVFGIQVNSSGRTIRRFSSTYKAYTHVILPAGVGPSDDELDDSSDDELDDSSDDELDDSSDDELDDSSDDELDDSSDDELDDSSDDELDASSDDGLDDSSDDELDDSSDDELDDSSDDKPEGSSDDELEGPLEDELIFSLHGMERWSPYYGRGRPYPIAEMGYAFTMTGSLIPNYYDVNVYILPVFGSTPTAQYKLTSTKTGHERSFNANGFIYEYPFNTTASGSSTNNYMDMYGLDKLDAIYLSRYIALGSASIVYKNN